MTLDVQKQMLIEQRIANDGKSVLLAYLLLIFLGSLGVHRFYLGRALSGVIMLGVSLLGFVLMMTGAAMAMMTGGLSAGVSFFGALLLCVVGVWFIVDLFLVPGMVRGSNDRKRVELQQQFALMG